MASLELAENNGVAFTLSQADGVHVLARARGQLNAALVDYGDAGGQVLALADVGVLATDGREPANLDFWLNLAAYARSR